MKICEKCSLEHNQPRSPFCVKCQRKINHKRYCDENKEKRYEHMRKWRINNPEKMRERARKSYCKKMGISRSDLKTKARSGSGHTNKRGYRVLSMKNHPNSIGDSGWIFEHTFVMSQHLSRPLRKGESVHHKNGIKHDNRIENLELWSRGQPAGQRVEDKITWCLEFLEGYLNDEDFRIKIANWVKSQYQLG